MLRPKALDQIGLVVSDIDQSLYFYPRLGSTVLRRSEPAADGTRSVVRKVGNREINVFCRPDFIPTGSGEPRGIARFRLVMDSATIEGVVGAPRQAGVDLASGKVKRRAAEISSTTRTALGSSCR
jgi:catechol 2,3-dioxygenase-like lactoylglutathione lyase family enzyme